VGQIKVGTFSIVISITYRMNGGGAEPHRKMTMNEGWLAAGGGEDGHPSNTKKLDELPERIINHYVLVLTVALMTVRGLGVLAFAWSTVVLLGGFVTLLGRLDFWFVTLISFAQSARYVGNCYRFSIRAMPSSLHDTDYT
jgi:hypothetical protein